MVREEGRGGEDNNDPFHSQLDEFWYLKEIDPEYREYIIRVISNQKRHPIVSDDNSSIRGLRELPAFVCMALGGKKEFAKQLNKAWELVYLAFHILDKIEDQEIDNALTQYDVGVLTNVTTGLILQAELILAKLKDSMEKAYGNKRRLLILFNRLALDVCAGQHTDLSSSENSLPQAWKIASGKSGKFFALECKLGAYIATENFEQIKKLEEFGHCVGLLLQIANDVEGLWSQEEEVGDLLQGKVTIPIAYALWVLPERKRAVLREYLNNPTANTEDDMRVMIIENGALVYLALEAEKIRQQAKSILTATALMQTKKDQLEMVLERVASFDQRT